MGKSQSEFANEFVEAFQGAAPEITDSSEGSDLDIIAQTVSTAVSELQEISNRNTRKTFFKTANGSEITGNEDELEALAVDQFGEDFARPEAVKSSGVVTFSRPNNNAGDVLIPAGTIVKTQKTSAGNSVSFETEIDVTLVGTSISVAVKSLLAGSSQNVIANKITVIESSLSDSSVTVNNALGTSGGKDTLNDAEYRIFIKNLIQTIKGATLKALKAKALTVSGVVYAEAIQYLLSVKEWDGAAAIGAVFKLPKCIVYVADANGTANASLITSVKTALRSTKAAGVIVTVSGANPVVLNWSAQIALNPAGDNYAELQSDLSMITEEMENYINLLPIGQNFNKAAATSYIISKFGAVGSNDLTSFITLSPTADVAAAATDKFVAGDMVV